MSLNKEPSPYRPSSFCPTKHQPHSSQGKALGAAKRNCGSCSDSQEQRKCALRTQLVIPRSKMDYYGLVQHSATVKAGRRIQWQNNPRLVLLSLRSASLCIYKSHQKPKFDHMCSSFHGFIWAESIKVLFLASPAAGYASLPDMSPQTVNRQNCKQIGKLSFDGD